MGHTHSHTAAPAAAGRPASAAYRRRLLGVLLILAAVAALEITIGLISGSLALLSDAGHVAVDVLGVGMTLAAVQAAASGSRSGRRTYGLYRIEVLSTLVNAVLLSAVAIWVLYEAVGRFREPAHVAGAAMIMAAGLGLIGNTGALLLLRRGRQAALSIRGASMEVLADTVASLGAIIAGVVLVTTGWQYADPIVAAAVALMILPRAVTLGRAALRVLLEIAPKHVDMSEVASQLAGISGVVDIHDLHVWTLTSGMESATAHISISDERDASSVLSEARACLGDHGIHHATVQVETIGLDGACRDTTW